MMTFSSLLQGLLSQIWWGDMKRNTEVWKHLLTFFCPILCYTNLISFRYIPFQGSSFLPHRYKVDLNFQLLHRKEEEQQKQEKSNEDGVGRDTDSLYGATVFSFSDIKHM